MRIRRGVRLGIRWPFVLAMAACAAAVEQPELPAGFWQLPPSAAALAWAEACAPPGSGWRLELPPGEAPADCSVALVERHQDDERVVWLGLHAGEAAIVAGRASGWEAWSRTPAPQAALQWSDAAPERQRHGAAVAWHLTRVSARWQGPGAEPAKADEPLLVLGPHQESALWAGDGVPAMRPAVEAPSSPAWDQPRARRAIAALLRRPELGLARQRASADGHRRLFALPDGWRPLVPPALLGQAALAAAVAGEAPPEAAVLAAWNAVVAGAPSPDADAAALAVRLAATPAIAAQRLGVLVRVQQREAAADAEWIASNAPGWRLAEGRLRGQPALLATALARRLGGLAADPATAPVTLQHASAHLARIDPAQHRASLAGLAITRADHPLLLDAARVQDDDAAVRARLRPLLLAALADPAPVYGRARTVIDLLTPLNAPRRDPDPAIETALTELASRAAPTGWDLPALARGLLRRGQDAALAAAVARLDAAAAWQSPDALLLLGELVVAGGTQAADAERRLRTAPGVWAPWAAWAAGLPIDAWAGRDLDPRLRTAWAAHEVAARLEALIGLAAGSLRDHPDALLDQAWRRQWARDLAAAPASARPTLGRRLAAAGDAPLLRGLAIP